MLRVLDGAVLVVSRGRGRAGADARADAHAAAPAHPDADLRQQDRPARRATRTRVARRGARASCGSRRRRSARAELAELLADHSRRVPRRLPRTAARTCGDELAAQAGRALVHPLFLRSAITGAGVDALMGGIAELLPEPPKADAVDRYRAPSSRSSAAQAARRSPTRGCSLGTILDGRDQAAARPR